MSLPKKSPYVIIGAGVHGTSTAYHLAKALKARGRGSGKDIIVLDKTGIAAGASGIACGVVRNFYYQPAMGAVMRASVEVWESDMESFCYNPVGFLAVVGPVQANDLHTIHERQQQEGYDSTLISGEQETFDYMRSLFPDWKARGLNTVLHEHQGGFAWNAEAIHGIANKAEAEGVEIIGGVEVTGFERNGDGSVKSVITNRGTIETDHVVIGVGPWVKRFWQMLDLPMSIDIKGSDGQVHKEQRMWTYWRLQEGEIQVDPLSFATADGKMPSVIHVDSTEPLISDQTGATITEALWGIYFKRDRHGVQGGAVPENLGGEAQVDPYGAESPFYTVDDNFVDYWTAGLAHCLERFEGCSKIYKHAPTGGIGCFTADSFPVFDYMAPNVYVIADSNHGYKMIGVGREVAKVMMGDHSEVLHPFRFARFAEGDLHPTSNSPFPWS